MKAYTLLILFTALLTFTACGGGGGKGNGNGKDPAEGKGIAVCEGNDKGLAKATILKDGNKIKQIKNNPSIRLWHLSNKTKKACVINGSAELL